MGELVEAIKKLLRSVLDFALYGSGIKLRKYQELAAHAITNSVIHHLGLTFVVMFPRQSGKNELQAQIETYLLALYSMVEENTEDNPGGQTLEIVKASPTWKPQSLNAMRRLERVLKRNLVTHDRWVKESGYIYRVGSARIFFLAGGPQANVVGATANILLECDEAQDVQIAKWDKDFAPMAASTNATRVFWGTAWTSTSLLARELRAAKAAQARDGVRRVFVLGAPEVAVEVPAYGAFVEEQVAKMGRNHPMIRSQFYSEEIDAEGGMFPASRISTMLGTHPRQHEPTPGRSYALLLDLAGEDEGITGEDVREYSLTETLHNPKRDSTAATIVEVDLTTLSDELIKAPTYKAVERISWIGVKHSALYGQLVALAQAWNARHLVVDATGVGLGLASFLEKALPGRVKPFTFNSSTKSKLGWAFLSVIETGRFQDWKANPWDADERTQFTQQLQACQMEIVPGPEKHIRWGVPDGTRDPATGELLHDDWVLSAALSAVLDDQEWAVSGAPVIVQRADPLLEMDREKF